MSIVKGRAPFARTDDVASIQPKVRHFPAAIDVRGKTEFATNWMMNSHYHSRTSPSSSPLRR